MDSRWVTTAFAVSICVVAFLAAATPSVTRAQWTETLAPGVDYFQRVDPGPIRISAVRIDLCASGVSMRVTASGERGQRTSSWGSSVGATVAVNAGFFQQGNPSKYDPTLKGITVHEGVKWPDAVDSNRQGWIAFGVRRSELKPESLAPPAAPWFQEAVNGGVPIIVDGSPNQANNRGPRTITALSQDGRYVFMIVADGRSGSSIGITENEVSSLLLSLGAHQAMNMDGGGSSAMWVAGKGVVNRPSDGSERTVLNHLAVMTAEPNGVPGVHCPWKYGAEFEESTFVGGLDVVTAPGCILEGELRFLNTGEAQWHPILTRLAPTQPRDRNSELAHEWLSETRTVALSDPTLVDEVGAFRFSIKAPDTAGEYSQSFGLVQEFFTWFADDLGPADDAVTLNVSVVQPTNDGTDRCIDPLGQGITDPNIDPDAGTDATTNRRAFSGGLVSGCVISIPHSNGTPWLFVLAAAALRVRQRRGQARGI